MKNLKVITLISILLVALSASDLFAQRRPENTRSARAAYGYPDGGHYTTKKSKKKKSPKRKKQKKVKAKKADGKQPGYRKKSPWVN